MRFNPRARIDTSGVQDRTGGGGGRGGGIAIGGIGGLIIVLIGLFLGVDLTGLAGGGSPPPSQTQSDDGSLAQKCRSGTDANEDEKCQLAAIVQSVNGFWAEQFPRETDGQYERAVTVPFTGAVSTDGCGQASSDAGPFYCPNDQQVYLDLTFFSDMLERLGGQDAGFTRAYVVAHEYGHHVENLLGVLGQVRTQQGPNSDAVKVELMADCLAGAWAKNAMSTEDATGQPLFSEITDQDIADAIGAAQTVGDDRIQQRTSGRVAPEVWTHGSAQQRETAFKQGLREGTISSCNLF